MTALPGAQDLLDEQPEVYGPQKGILTSSLYCQDNLSINHTSRVGCELDRELGVDQSVFHLHIVCERTRMGICRVETDNTNDGEASAESMTYYREDIANQSE